MAIETTTATSVTPTSSTEMLGLDGTNSLKRHNAAKFGIGAPQEWTIWAGHILPQATAGAQRGIAYMATNLQPVETLDFDQTTQEFAVAIAKLPKRWNLGTFTFRPLWTAASGSGGVVWSVEALAVGDDDTLDAAYGTAQTSTDTLLSANDLHVGPESSAITAAGTPAAGDVLLLRVKRVPADAGDTLAADAKLLGIVVTWTQTIGSDA